MVEIIKVQSASSAKLNLNRTPSVLNSQQVESIPIIVPYLKTMVSPAANKNFKLTRHFVAHNLSRRYTV
jgi:hypothetical protein